MAPRLRAVITQASNDFIVSVTVIASEEVPMLIGEETVATIDAAHDVVKKLALEGGYPLERVETIYNLDDVSPDSSRAN